MKKIKKLIIIALCFALLLSMFTFSTFAADDPSDGDVDAAAALSHTVWYVPAGWSCESGVFIGDLDFISFSYSERSVAPLTLGLGFGGVSSPSPSPSPDFITLVYGSDDIVFLDPTFDFCFSFGEISSSVDVTGLYDFLLLHGELLASFDFISDFFSGDKIVSSGWTVPSDYCELNFFRSVLYEGFCFFYSLGFSDIDSPSSDTVFFVPLEYEYLESVSFTSEDSFVFSLDFSSFGSSVEDIFLFYAYNTPLIYFLKNNSVLVPPPPESEALTDDIFSVFGSVGSWISGAASSLVSMFWDGSDLTFVGILSVSALALSVVFLVLSLIEKFLRFGG